MLKKDFDELVELHGDKVVWIDEDGHYCFCLNDSLLDDYFDDKEVNELHNRLDEECNKTKEINWYVGYGDDVANCVSVANLTDFDKVNGLEEFVFKYVGSNCYSREDEFDYDDE